MVKIEQIQEENLEQFFQYLDRHLRENGADDFPVFQPISLDDSKVTPEIEARFREGVRKNMEGKSWRRLFVAVNAGDIIGHIDIRPYPDNHTAHRALLGMGVDSSCRGQGVGRQLVSHLVEWVRSTPFIEYIDLWVLSENYPAKSLYRKCGFTQCGDIGDMFRFDGRSLGYTMMSLHAAPGKL